MFTGIVTALGRITHVEDVEGLRRMRVEVAHDWGDEPFLSGAGVGDSIAVDGACLTAVSLDAALAFDVELVLSTLDRTVAGDYEVGSVVNLERAARLGSRLDGHIVQGHVDGVGRLAGAEEAGGTHFLDLEVPPEVWAQTILHGSITLNGVSLTVNELSAPDRVQIAIIPHTWQVTNLGRLSPGDPVNVEGDMIGKYVKKLVSTGTLPATPGDSA